MLMRSHAALGGINQPVHIYAAHPTCWAGMRNWTFRAAPRARLCHPAHQMAVPVSACLAGFLSPFKDFMSRVQAGSVLA
jgi:hypothetical protein